MSNQVKTLSQLVFVPQGSGVVEHLTDAQLDHAENVVRKQPNISVQSLLIIAQRFQPEVAARV